MPGSDEPQWVIDHAVNQRRTEALQQRKDLNARLAKIKAREDRARARFESGERPHKRQRLDEAAQTFSAADDEATFLLEDYESDREDVTKFSSTRPDLGLSAETLSLLERASGGPVKTIDPEETVEDELKVFFCSRTHSQLSQFVNELRRVHLPPSVDVETDDPTSSDRKSDASVIESVKQLTLGSRKNLCINEKVSKLGSVTAINERCLELQQSKTPKDAKCPHMPTRDNEALVHDFRDRTLAKIRDIEDLGALGRKIGVCPYYASRAAIKPSELVTLPYPLLLQKSAREALNLSLKDHVVIIDEAHNLVDAISNIHSVSVSLAQLLRSRAQLETYLQKFRNRLKGKNRVYIAQLVRLIDSLTLALQEQQKAAAHTDCAVEMSYLMRGKGVDQINLHKLMRYLQESKLARKVDGYHVYIDEQSSIAAQKSRGTTVSKASLGTMPVLTHVSTFMHALANPSAEGRFFCSHDDTTPGKPDAFTLKYLLLDPTKHFKEIVEEARAVVLAGGTLSPINDYRESLVPDIPSSRVLHLSCGHVIPSSSLVAAPVDAGPGAVQFDFTFGNRNSSLMIQELGHAIIDLASVVPDGMVVFFPSYSYLNAVIQQWQKIKKDGTMWNYLSSIKKIFLEPGALSNPNSKPQQTSTAAPKESAETVLSAYTAHIANNSSKGALLFAVISGSLSEGINFSDALGRLIPVVGLPFPNPSSPSWRAKLEFVKERARRTESARLTSHSDAVTATTAAVKPTSETIKLGEAAAQQHTLATTMRAVNQSIGRAIRHKNDWAAILLLDRRYGRSDVLEKLPPWIARSMMGSGGGVQDGTKKGGRSWREVMAGLEEFYREKQP
ncbi:MAG: ATP-dependent DNA helicase chl1 [Chrysothrix sp. TS-e1954]|nr:MAG: ATP-dependent DNA helicase chl1 [Chrysothrix sp. TS-e1954]